MLRVAEGQQEEAGAPSGVADRSHSGTPQRLPPAWIDTGLASVTVALVAGPRDEVENRRIDMQAHAPLGCGGGVGAMQ